MTYILERGITMKHEDEVRYLVQKEMEFEKYLRRYKFCNRIYKKIKEITGLKMRLFLILGDFYYTKCSDLIDESSRKMVRLSMELESQRRQES